MDSVILHEYGWILLPESIGSIRHFFVIVSMNGHRNVTILATIPLFPIEFEKSPFLLLLYIVRMHFTKIEIDDWSRRSIKCDSELKKH